MLQKVQLSCQICVINICEGASVCDSGYIYLMCHRCKRVGYNDPQRGGGCPPAQSDMGTAHGLHAGGCACLQLAFVRGQLRGCKSALKSKDTRE